MVPHPPNRAEHARGRGYARNRATRGLSRLCRRGLRLPTALSLARTLHRRRGGAPESLGRVKLTRSTHRGGWCEAARMGKALLAGSQSRAAGLGSAEAGARSPCGGSPPPHFCSQMRDPLARIPDRVHPEDGRDRRGQRSSRAAAGERITSARTQEVRKQALPCDALGEVAERSNAAVSKPLRVVRLVEGSNPSLSARTRRKPRSQAVCGRGRSG